MDVTINTRHCTVPESIRNQTQIRLQRVARFNPVVQGGTVNFNCEGSERQVDVRLHMKGTAPLLGHGTGGTFRTALDRAIERVERQLKSRNQRNRNRRPPAHLQESAITA